MTRMLKGIPASHPHLCWAANKQQRERAQEAGCLPPSVSASGPSAQSLRSRSFQMDRSSAEGAVPMRPAKIKVLLCERVVMICQQFL